MSHEEATSTKFEFSEKKNFPISTVKYTEKQRTRMHPMTNKFATKLQEPKNKIEIVEISGKWALNQALWVSFKRK